MEIKQYLQLAKKWAWLLILGAILGAGGAYGFSILQPVVYQTSTQIMVSQAQNQVNQTYYNSYYDMQLAESYSRIINTSPVMKALEEKLGYPLNAGLSVKQNTNTNVLVLTATGGDPAQITEIANTWVDVFIEYNKSLQDENYKATEDNLIAQIAQVEEQIATLQSEMSQISETTQENLKQQREEQAKQIAALLTEADQELLQLEMQLETYIPTPEVTNTPAPEWIIPTSTPVPVATPTLSAAGQLEYREMEIRRDQLNQLRNMYQQAYADLLVMNQTSSDPTLRQSQIQTTLALYQQIYSNLLSSYENVRLSRLRSTPNVVQIEPAREPGTPIQPQPMRNTLLGGVSGLMIMGALAFLIEYMDDTLKTPEDINRYLGLPVLGLIGGMGRRNGKASQNGSSGVYVSEKPLSQIAEAFRNLRTNLEFASLEKPIKLLQVTSAGPGEGKSTVAANLAAVIAQGERSVLLLDADLRRPMIHRYLGAANNQGLIDLLRNPAEFDNIVTEWGTPPAKAITAGELPPNPTELLASTRMDLVLNELKEKADIVIIDTAPTIITDPIVMSAKVDGVLVVIEPGKTKIGAAQVMLEQLQRAGARVVGVVLNPISRKHSGYSTRYNYYYSSYYSGKYSHYSGENGRGKKKEK